MNGVDAVRLDGHDTDVTTQAMLDNADLEQ